MRKREDPSLPNISQDSLGQKTKGHLNFLVLYNFRTKDGMSWSHQSQKTCRPKNEAASCSSSCLCPHFVLPVLYLVGVGVFHCPTA